MKAVDYKNLIINSDIIRLGRSKDTEESDNILDMKILNWINRSLRKIYADTLIAQKAVRLDIYEGKMLYDLPDDYMSILSVFRGGSEVDIPINREDRVDSIFTPEPFKLLVPEFFSNSYIDIVYLKSPEVITSMDQRIPLMDQFSEAMLFYIIYIGHELIHSGSNSIKQVYYQKYLDEIKILQANGLIQNNGIVNYKIYLKGFV
jgi:hypothetical protein